MQTRYKTIQILLILLLLVASCAPGSFVLSVQAAGNIYYVAVTGNDGNPGSASQPFQTIQKAADIVNPGDTVLVNDGVYTKVAGTACSDIPTVLCLTRGGTPSAWVTFKSINRGGAKLSGQNHSVELGVRTVGSNSSYIEVNGFEVYDTAGDAFILNVIGQTDFRIVNNHIHSIGKICVPMFDSVGISVVYTVAQRTSLIGNAIHDIGRLQDGEAGCSTTDIYHNHDHGVYAPGEPYGSGAHDLTVINNLFYDVIDGWPIAPGPGAVTNMTVVNNTFADANPVQSGQILYFNTDTISNAQVENNIFYAPNTAAIYYYSGAYTFNSACVRSTCSLR